jgi:hypothetical protein
LVEKITTVFHINFTGLFQFAQVANDWGFAHDYPLEIAEARRMIMADKCPPMGTSISQTDM